MKRFIPVALICCMTWGCQTPGQTAALECGAGGAAAAILLCAVLGGDAKTCAAVGAAAGLGGAAICYSYASNLEKRRQALEGKENDLDARLRYVRGVNADSEQLNQQLRTRVAEVTQETDAIVAQMQQKKISQAELAKKRELLDKEVKVANEQLVLAKKALDDMKRFQAQQARESRELDAEIAKQERLFAETQRETTALAAQRQRV